MFADLELVGIPHRITIGERGLKEGQIEYQARSDKESRNIPLNEILDFVQSL
jgi:prolyl-tRNA synthetase